MRGSILGLLIVAAGVVLALPLAAQEVFEVLVLDQGEPIPDAPVSVVLGDVLGMVGKRPAGSTGPDGTLSMNPNALGFEDGEVVEVWVRDCEDGRGEVILRAEGSGDPCEGEEEAEEPCGCRLLGTFRWGPGRLTVDVGRGTVAHRPSPQARPEGARRWIGVSVALSHFGNLEEAIEAQTGLADSRLSPTAPQIGIQYGFHPSPRFPLVVGGQLSYTRFSSIEQNYVAAPGGPASSEIDFSVISAGPFVGWELHLSPIIQAWLLADLVWALNRIAIETFYDGLDEPVSGDRDEGGLRMGLRLGLNYSPSDRFSVGLLGGAVSGKGDDADAQLIVGALVRYFLFGPRGGGL